MSKGAAPPPNYQGAADKQSQASQQAVNTQTLNNRADQTNPFASAGWVQDAGGRWHEQIGFTGQMADAANSLQGQVASNFAQPMDNGSAARDQAIKATYDQMASRLNPQMDFQQQQMETQLANQGLSPGSAAYRQAEATFGRNRNDAYQNAMNNAVQQGLQAQNLTFNQNMAARNAPMQELQGMSGFLAMPGYSQAGAAEPAQYLAAALGLGNYQLADAQMKNEALGGLYSGIGSMIGESAKAFKGGG